MARGPVEQEPLFVLRIRAGPPDVFRLWGVSLAYFVDVQRVAAVALDLIFAVAFAFEEGAVRALAVDGLLSVVSAEVVVSAVVLVNASGAVFAVAEGDVLVAGVIVVVAGHIVVPFSDVFLRKGVGLGLGLSHCSLFGTGMGWN